MMNFNPTRLRWSSPKLKESPQLVLMIALVEDHVILGNVIASMVIRVPTVVRACVLFCVHLTASTVVVCVTVRMAGKVPNATYR